MNETPRNEALEADLWRIMRAHRVTAPDACALMDALLGTFDAYAAGDSEWITVARREVLAREAW